jgi:hypothetical protein
LVILTGTAIILAQGGIIAITIHNVILTVHHHWYTYISHIAESPSS